ncbi:MAG: LysM domain-containing protein [Phototrophicaceae bacterium]
MKRLMVLLVVLSSIILVNVASVTAQTAPNDIDISVNITCSSIEVMLVSNYYNAIKAEAFVGNGSDYNLLATVGDFTRANAYGSASRVYTFENQPANTQLIYSVRVYNDESNVLVDRLDASGNCSGANQPAPVTTTPTQTTTNTASFLAACDLIGGITVQPIGGVPFGITGMQIAQGTAMAMANNQNIAITNTGGITVLGTPANAIQLIASDGYSLIIPAVSCTQTASVSNSGNVSSVAVQAAQLSCNNTPADAVRTHVVSAGENLFRIGLRYGVPFTRLAAYNGIPDATRIFVGQCIAIPPSA